MHVCVSNCSATRTRQSDARRDAGPRSLEQQDTGEGRSGGVPEPAHEDAAPAVGAARLLLEPLRPHEALRLGLRHDQKLPFRCALAPAHQAVRGSRGRQGGGGACTRPPCKAGFLARGRCASSRRPALRRPLSTTPIDRVASRKLGARPVESIAWQAGAEAAERPRNACVGPRAGRSRRHGGCPWRMRRRQATTRIMIRVAPGQATTRIMPL